MNEQKERSIKYGDNVDTDVIIPARYLNTSDARGAGRPLHGGHRQGVSSKRVQPGDIMVAGKNFGCGSSREHAPHRHQGLRHRPASSPRPLPGFSTATPSTSAWPSWSASEAAQEIEAGDEVTVDFDTGVITDVTTGQELPGAALPALHPEHHQERGTAQFSAGKGAPND